MLMAWKCLSISGRMATLALRDYGKKQNTNDLGIFKKGPNPDLSGFGPLSNFPVDRRGKIFSHRLDY